MEYKLIGIDMDGTLLNSKNKISISTKKAILAAQKQDIYIVITTGRILKSAIYYSNSLNLNNPIIACNGAIVADSSQKIIYERTLEKDKVKDIINLAKAEEIYFHFYDRSSFYSNIRSEEVLRFYDEGNESINIDLNIIENTDDIIHMDNLNIYKIIFVENNLEKLQKFRKKIEEIEDISVSSSWINNLEVMKDNVSKGKALENLCKNLDIKAEEVITIGDSENDLSMFEFSGLSVSMKNASDEIKKRTDFVTDFNDEDGVAKVIEKFILK